MQKFLSHTGIGVPLRSSNVDTDQIIPAAFMKRITRTGYEDGLFAAWRTDPQFVLNDERYCAGSVLVAGPDFGTGSSREHAVWALVDYGFKAVLSSRFADIFRGNAGKVGLVAAEVEQSDLEIIWNILDARPGTSLKVDLETRSILIEALRIPFVLDDYTRWRLMEGLDDIDLTLRNQTAIAMYETSRDPWSPRISI